MEKTIESLISILSNATHREDFTDIDLDKSLKDQGIDSLDTMSFFFSLEKEFNIKISVEEQNTLHSLNDILRFVSSK
jgi:acyl carrier protein